MPELPKKKVGIVACSGEELAEGTVTRLAALKVLEELRPSDTVTICLPLFLAGGEGDRAFARFYPTIAIDGCGLRCAAKGTELYSGKPAASLVVTDLVSESGLPKVAGRRSLNEAGQQAATITADRMAMMVDELLGKKWSRRRGTFVEEENITPGRHQVTDKTCACGSGIPIQSVRIGDEMTALIALPILFEQFREDGKRPSTETISELLAQLKVYNPVSEEEEPAYVEMLQREYMLFCSAEEPIS